MILWEHFCILFYMSVTQCPSDDNLLQLVNHVGLHVLVKCSMSLCCIAWAFKWNIWIPWALRARPWIFYTPLSGSRLTAKCCLFTWILRLCRWAPLRIIGTCQTPGRMRGDRYHQWEDCPCRWRQLYGRKQHTTTLEVGGWAFEGWNK